MKDSFWFARQCGFRGRRLPLLRPLFTCASKLIVRIRGGGVVFVESDKFVTRLLGEIGKISSQPVAYYADELKHDEPLERAFTHAQEHFGITKYRDWHDRVNRCEHLVSIYALIREMRPDVVVETGTARGSATSLMLAALHRNQHGRLISIDIPPVTGHLTMNISVARQDIGFYIPAEYRDRWKYIEGDSKIHLPGLLANQRTDIFVHDSLHTRTHMLFEYATARALLPEGALILSDDILWNNAFADFCAANRITAYAPYSNPYLGGVVNRFDAFEREIGTGVVESKEDESIE